MAVGNVRRDEVVQVRNESSFLEKRSNALQLPVYGCPTLNEGTLGYAPPRNRRSMPNSSREA
jgi:hypothetical protein